MTTGAVISDWNQDGFDDCYIAITCDAGCADEVLLSDGNGGWTFVTQPGTEDWSGEVYAGGDFDGDGFGDVVTVTREADGFDISMNSIVYVGRGDGRFVGATATSTDFAIKCSEAMHTPSDLIAADWNADGRDDVFLLCGGGKALMFFGSVDVGNFVPSTTEFGTTASLGGLAAADFNGDRVPDLFVAKNDGNSNGSPNVAFLSDTMADFSFAVVTAPLPSDAGPVPAEYVCGNPVIAWDPAVAGDYDGDGNLDKLLQCDSRVRLGHSEWRVFAGDGRGQFSMLENFRVPYDRDRRGVPAVGNYNGDRYTDVFIQGRMFLATADGFEESGLSLTGPDEVVGWYSGNELEYPYARAIVADFDNNGVSDLMLIGIGDNAKLAVCCDVQGDNDGPCYEGGDWCCEDDTGAQSFLCAWVDSGQGNYERDSSYAAGLGGTMCPESGDLAWIYPATCVLDQVPTVLAGEDVFGAVLLNNGDGTTWALKPLRGEGLGGEGLLKDLLLDRTPDTFEALRFTTGHFNDDNCLDLFVGGHRWFEPHQLLLSNCDGSFEDPTELPSASYGTRMAVTGDFNGDSCDDVYIIAVLRWTGAALDRGEVGPIPAGQQYDVARANKHLREPNQVLLGDGHGGFVHAPASAATNWGNSNYEVGAATGDFNGDGFSDLIVTPATTGGAMFAAMFYMGNAAGKLTEIMEGEVRVRSYSSVADWNNDGLDDIIVEHERNLFSPDRLWSFFAGDTCEEGFMARREAVYLPAVQRVCPPGLEIAQFENWDAAVESCNAARCGSIVVMGCGREGPFKTCRATRPRLARPDSETCATAFYRTFDTTCYECPQFTYDSSGSSSTGAASQCTVCPAGRLGLASGIRNDQQIMCGPCDPGRFRPISALVEECIECSPGQYATGGASYCGQCDPGRVTNRVGPGSTGCSACPVGREATPLQTECVDCSRGQYSLGVGMCQKCPFPEYTTDAQRCQVCDTFPQQHHVPLHI